jgi:hypothetical protein
MRVTRDTFKCDHCEAPINGSYSLARLFVGRDPNQTAFDVYYELCNNCSLALIKLIECWEQQGERPA